MYFGDEDPLLIADTHRTHLSNLPCSPEEQHTQTVDEMSGKSDLVLMYNEEAGSFEFNSGGADMSCSLDHDRSSNGDMVRYHLV